jgi:leader peptidase (prepilin peptidase)/N-methyltransferase
MLDAASDHPALRWLIGAITVAAVAAVAITYRDEPLTAALLVVVVLALGALSAIDVAQHRLPNRITYPLALASIVVVLGVGIWQGEVGRALAAIGVGVGFAFVLLVLRFGLGDVKLAISIGTISGWLGWSAVAATMLATAVSGAVVGVALMAVHRRRDVAFGYGPFMALGAVVGMLAAAGAG